MRAKWVYRSSLSIQVFCGLLNVALAVRVFYVLRSPVHNDIHINEIHPEIPVYTNFHSFATLPSPVSSNSFFASKSDSLHDYDSSIAVELVNESVIYDYLVDCGRPCFLMNGRYYYVGDRTAWGVVLDIFPEFVYLDSGKLRNDLSRRPLIPLKPQTRKENNDNSGNVPAGSDTYAERG